jgi:hypothetical protein
MEVSKKVIAMLHLEIGSGEFLGLLLVSDYDYFSATFVLVIF